MEPAIPTYGGDAESGQAKYRHDRKADRLAGGSHHRGIAPCGHRQIRDAHCRTGKREAVIAGNLAYAG